MNHRKLTNAGMSVSEIGPGCWSPGRHLIAYRIKMSVILLSIMVFTCVAGFPVCWHRRSFIQVYCIPVPTLSG